MPLFSTERKRKEKDLEREVRLKQGIGPDLSGLCQGRKKGICPEVRRFQLQ